MTGGGMYPALAVLQALANKTSKVLWVGSESKMEQELLKPYNLEFEAVPAAGLHGVGLWTFPGNFSQLLRGWRKAKSVIREFQPDVMFFTGGYLGVPVAMAGRQVPSVVFVPDIEPGMALKAIIRFSEIVAAVTEKTAKYIKNIPVEKSGYPIRKELKEWTKQKARKHFGITENDKTLLVYGGSKGARSINQALLKILPDLLKEMHVIHITGMDHFNSVLEATEKLPSGLKNHYHIYSFLHEEMGAAFATADLVVCRAGASTLGELPYFGLPAILVPYPYAWRYQHKNAEFLREKGCAVILEDQMLEQELPGKIKSLINNPDTLQKMSDAMKEISKPNAADRIAEMILQAGNSTAVKEDFNG